MTKAQHTKGPWKRSHNIITTQEGHLIAECTKRGIEETKANGNILAASCEMLEALYAALCYVEDVLGDPVQLACFKKGTVEKDAKQIRDAIAKAEGK